MKLEPRERVSVKHFLNEFPSYLKPMLSTPATKKKRVIKPTRQDLLQQELPMSPQLQEELSQLRKSHAFTTRMVIVYDRPFVYGFSQDLLTKEHFCLESCLFQERGKQWSLKLEGGFTAPHSSLSLCRHGNNHHHVQFDLFLFNEDKAKDKILQTRWPLESTNCGVCRYFLPSYEALCRDGFVIYEMGKPYITVGVKIHGDDHPEPRENVIPHELGLGCKHCGSTQHLSRRCPHPC